MLQASVHQLPPDQTPRPLRSSLAQTFTESLHKKNLCARLLGLARAAEGNGVLLGSQRVGGAPHRPMESIDSRKEETRSLGRKCVGVTGFSLHAQAAPRVSIRLLIL